MSCSGHQSSHGLSAYESSDGLGRVIVVRGLLKSSVRGERILLGTLNFSRDPAVVEVMGHAGLDFVVIDLEHGALDLREVEENIRAADAVGLAPLVRLGERAPTLISRVLDIGAQSTRAVKLRDVGKVKEFKTNDKCAAGAGGFLERAARYLEVKLEAIGDLSLHADKPQQISSVCAVLAESEIINHVSSGQSVENILRGIHDSLASRAMTLLSRVGLDGELTFVGGVARQGGMVKALEAVAKVPVNVPAEPETVGALGAALLALQRLERREVRAA